MVLGNRAQMYTSVLVWECGLLGGAEGLRPLICEHHLRESVCSVADLSCPFGIQHLLGRGLVIVFNEELDGLFELRKSGWPEVVIHGDHDRLSYITHALIELVSAPESFISFSYVVCQHEIDFAPPKTFTAPRIDVPTDTYRPPINRVHVGVGFVAFIKGNKRCSFVGIHVKNISFFHCIPDLIVLGFTYQQQIKPMGDGHDLLQQTRKIRRIN